MRIAYNVKRNNLFSTSFGKCEHVCVCESDFESAWRVKAVAIHSLLTPAIQPLAHSSAHKPDKTKDFRFDIVFQQHIKSSVHLFLSRSPCVSLRSFSSAHSSILLQITIYIRHEFIQLNSASVFVVVVVCSIVFASHTIRLQIILKFIFELAIRPEPLSSKKLSTLWAQNK